MSSPLRILIVAYSFPPSADVGRIRIVHFCNHLPEFGIQPVVLTVQEQFCKALDHTSSVPSGLRVIRARQWKTPLDRYASWKSAQSAATPDKFVSEPVDPSDDANPSRRLRDHIISALSVPDLLWGWYFPAVRAGARLLRNEHFDVIFSTAPPFTSHLIAKKLHQRFRIPWVADFRDPWFTGVTPSWSQQNWRDRLDERIEAGCVRSASLVICNTSQLQKAMSERYHDIPEARFVTLTNGFDDTLAPPEAIRAKHNPILCLHLGNVYPGRRVDIFCAALSLKVRQQKLLANQVKILFTGGIERSQMLACRRVAGELIDSGMIEFRERVDNQEARKLLSQADLLLLFQGEFRVQIPLKFYEYLPTGKPMFAVCQPGALSEVMAQTDAGISVGDQNTHEIGERFISALNLEARPPEVVQHRWREQFHFHSLTRRLAGWIQMLVQRNA